MIQEDNKQAIQNNENGQNIVKRVNELVIILKQAEQRFIPAYGISFPD